MSATTIEAASGAELHVHGGDLELHVNGEGLQLHLHGDAVRLHVHGGQPAPAQPPPARSEPERKPDDAGSFTVRIPSDGGHFAFAAILPQEADLAEIAKLAARYGMEFLGPNFIINSLGMRMVELLPGTFLMGSPDGDADARPDEKPQHRAIITKHLMMGMHAVTVGQFKRFLDDTGYETEGERNGIGSFGLDLRTGKVEPKPQYTWRTWLAENPDRPSGFVQTDDHPIVCVSFEDAREFCRWLSDREGRRYRLPTEAEWEHACRAGTTTRYFNGDAVEGLREIANIADAALQEKWVWNAGEPPFPDGTHLPPYAQPWNDGYPFTAPVGRFEPNAFGLYDMAGNVGEWCSDWYDPGYYAEAPEKDPQGPGEGPPIDVSQVVPGTEPRPLRVIRGGVWLDPAHSFRSADRQTHLRHPVDSAADIGFRVVLEL